MTTMYTVTTNTVHPLEDAPPGSYSWYPFGGPDGNRDATMRWHVEVRTAAELTAELREAARLHLDAHPEAPAVKVFATPKRGYRHVRGGVKASEMPMIVRDTTSYTVESDGVTYEFGSVFAPLGGST